MGLFGETLGILFGDKVLEATGKLVDKALSTDLGGKVMDSLLSSKTKTPAGTQVYVIVKDNNTLKSVDSDANAVWNEGRKIANGACLYFESREEAMEFVQNKGLDSPGIGYRSATIKSN